MDEKYNMFRGLKMKVIHWPRLPGSLSLTPTIRYPWRLGKVEFYFQQPRGNMQWFMWSWPFFNGGHPYNSYRCAWINVRVHL